MGGVGEPAYTDKKDRKNGGSLALFLRRGRQGYNCFFDTFIVLGLLEEAPQRNMRWHLSLS